MVKKAQNKDRSIEKCEEDWSKNSKQWIMIMDAKKKTETIEAKHLNRDDGFCFSFIMDHWMLRERL